MLLPSSLSSLYIQSIVIFLSRLHPNNVLGVRSFADQFMCGGLVDACNSYIQKQFVEVMMSDEFLALPAEEVSSIISQDELCVESEEVVSIKDICVNVGSSWLWINIKLLQSPTYNPH